MVTDDGRRTGRDDAVGGAGVMTVRQLSTYLQVSHGHVYEMARRGRIPAIRLGRKWRFRREQIDRWLDDLARNGAAVGE
jgi:excisionase family DNA binding protein